MWTSVFFYHGYRSFTKSGNGFTTTRVNTMISSFAGDSFCIWKETEEFRDSSGWRTYEKDEELY